MSKLFLRLFSDKIPFLDIDIGLLIQLELFLYIFSIFRLLRRRIWTIGHTIENKRDALRKNRSQISQRFIVGLFEKSWKRQQ